MFLTYWEYDLSWYSLDLPTFDWECGICHSREHVPVACFNYDLVNNVSKIGSLSKFLYTCHAKHNPLITSADKPIEMGSRWISKDKSKCRRTLITSCPTDENTTEHFSLVVHSSCYTSQIVSHFCLILSWHFVKRNLIHRIKKLDQISITIYRFQ